MEANLASVNSDLDLDLQERVNDAIHTLDVLRGSRAHVDVTVSGGQVTLTGSVQSPMAAAEVAHVAAAVAGPLPVVNHIVDDATLNSQVAEMLATDARTSAIAPGYQVAAVYGHLMLIGRFTPQESQAMTAVAGAVPGLRSITVKTI